MQKSNTATTLAAYIPRARRKYRKSDIIKKIW